jgi:hypothetical protein
MLEIAKTSALVLSRNRWTSSHEKPAAAISAVTMPPPAISAVSFRRSEE